MSQPQHPWSDETRSGFYPRPGGPPRSFNAPWMVPATPNQIPTYYLPTFTRRAPWSSDVTRGETTEGQIRLERDCFVQRRIVSTKRKSICTKFWRLLKGLFPCGKKKRAKRLDALTLPFVPHDRRNAYGCSPPPVVNRVHVGNSTLQHSSSATIKTDDLRRSLRGTHDAPRVANDWSGGTTLPPRPYDWSRIRFPPPLSHDLRLNPCLQHRCNGPHPIAFDIARGLNKIMHNTHASSTSITSLDPAHLTQPATYPPVTHMHMQSVAEDPLPHIPWPIEVTNARGITCGDVFDAISHKLLEHVSEEEYNTWTKHRRAAAARAYHQRARTSVDPHSMDKTPDVRDGLRRIDYMGEKVILVFHGLEQASAAMDDTWFVYLGANERSKV